VQIEGATREDGKGESIWDRYAAAPGKIADSSTPEVACDSYHRWNDDISLLKQMNLQSYRFSIAWPRILPQGRGPANPKGVDHYSRLIDGLLSANIRPLVTAYHWDLPQSLEDIGGWPNRDTAKILCRLRRVARQNTKTYGDRVTHWGLMNEPQAFTVVGYGWGIHAPGKADRRFAAVKQRRRDAWVSYF
jgi:beta-glucosidase